MENGEKTFDLSVLIKALRRFWLWIVIATVLVAVLAGAATVVYAKMKPSYRAETQYLVVSGASTSPAIITRIASQESVWRMFPMSSKQREPCSPFWKMPKWMRPISKRFVR